MPYTLNELSKEEADQVTKELQEVLAKHDCEMGVTSTINILKRTETPEKDAVLSPIHVNPGTEDNTPSTPA